MKLDLSLLFLPPLCYWDFSYSVTTRAFFVDPVRLKTNNGGCFSPFLARFVSIFNFTSRHVIDDALTHLARYLRKSVPACIYFSSCFVQTCQCSCLYLLFLLFCPDVSVLLPVFAPDPHWVLGIDIWKRDKLMSNHTTCRADLPSCSLMTGANGLVFMQCESTESWSAKQTLIL